MRLTRRLWSDDYQMKTQWRLWLEMRREDVRRFGWSTAWLLALVRRSAARHGYEIQVWSVEAATERRRQGTDYQRGWDDALTTLRKNLVVADEISGRSARCGVCGKIIAENQGDPMVLERTRGSCQCPPEERRPL